MKLNAFLLMAMLSTVRANSLYLRDACKDKKEKLEGDELIKRDCIMCILPRDVEVARSPMGETLVPVSVEGGAELYIPMELITENCVSQCTQLIKLLAKEGEIAKAKNDKSACAFACNNFKRCNAKDRRALQGEEESTKKTVDCMYRMIEDANLGHAPDQARFDRLRYVEIKHGRICQVAFLGQIVTRAGIHLPGEIDSDSDSHPIAAVIGSDAIPSAGLLQIIAFIGFLELLVMKDIEEAGDFP